jgi:excisionase family DNA binding protein
MTRRLAPEEIRDLAEALADEENTMKQTLTVNEIAARWGFNRKTILTMIHDGRIAAFRPGKRTYVVAIAEVERVERAQAA